jgi:hypothetical protein
LRGNKKILKSKMKEFLKIIQQNLDKTKRIDLKFENISDLELFQLNLKEMK